jgi:aryl carrier-like protein
MLLFIVDLSAMRPVYGEAAVEFALIEAGAMLQILRGVARTEGIGLCQIGALRFDLVRPRLRLGEDSRLVHAAVAGLPADERDAGAARPAGPAAGELNAGLTEIIAATWQELLQRKNIGHDENFFDAGGDSFLLVEMYQKLAGRVGADFTVTDLFRFPTIRSQAEYLIRDTVDVQASDIDQDQIRALPAPASRRERRRMARSGLQQARG